MTCAGRVVAEHLRVWARHQTLTDPAHADAAAQLRAHQQVRPRLVEDLEQRALGDYDLAFGLEELPAAVAS